jgi:integrase
MANNGEHHFPYEMCVSGRTCASLFAPVYYPTLPHFMAGPMGRRVRDSKLEKREDRKKLKPRADREPYWRGLREGLHLGYRVGSRGGVWIARFRDGAAYAKRTLGRADDFEDADGRDVLTYDQAQDAARRLIGVSGAPPTRATVEDAATAYLKWFRENRKSAKATEATINAHILPTLGPKRIDELTRAELLAWQQAIARAPARKRAKRGKPPAYRPPPQTDDDLRARRATANRVLNVLRALLNHAVEHELVPIPGPWRELKAFKGADMPKVRFLTPTEAARLANRAVVDLGRLVRGALFTGARFGELAALTVGDVDLPAAQVYIAPSKSGKARHVPLPPAGLSFFEELVTGRAAADPVFTRSGGTWGKNHHVRDLIDACAKAKIDPPITFHELRHTYASTLINAGVELPIIAKLLGHADTRITMRHYAHLADKTLAKAVRKLPAFGHEPTGKVKPIESSRRTAR